MGINNCIDIEKIIYQFFHELCHFIYYCLLYGIDKQFADEKEETICIKSLKREVYRNGFEDAQAVDFDIFRLSKKIIDNFTKQAV